MNLFEIKKIHYWTFTRKNKLIFLEELASLINDGVTVNRAIITIQEIHDGVIETVAKEVSRIISQGGMLADGLKNWFAPALVAAIRAGENGGTLAITLQTTANFYAQRSRALESLIKSLAYPVIVFIIALIVIVFVKNSVLESFANIKSVQYWPAVSQQLYDLGMVLQTWWWLIVLLTMTVILMIAWLLKDLTGIAREWIDTIPLLSLYRQFVAARFMETLGLLLINGMIIKDAIELLYQHASPYLAWHMLNMGYRLSSGQDNIAEVLNTNLLNKSDFIRLKVVAEGKGFGKALVSLGKAANQRNLNLLEVTGKVVAAMLLGLCTFLAIMIVLGIYGVGSVIAR